MTKRVTERVIEPQGHVWPIADSMKHVLSNDCPCQPWTSKGVVFHRWIDDAVRREIIEITRPRAT